MSGVKPKGNNAQHQPLTTALRNIIREYPSGGGVLRELTQNADDAGANTVEFVLDEDHHPCDPLLHPGLAEFQGPSLMAFNNKTFSDKDFRSLSRIGDSEKAHDLSATGKFGRGFNSVYNWTDGPSILSGTSLLLLDPHESWSRDPNIGEPGGPVYDFVENAQEEVMINQLSPFKKIFTDFSRPFEGTIIRLPLRTADQAKTSKILDLDPKPTEIADIKEVFNSFAAEISESLLFLRNVSSITLRIGDEVFAKGIAKKYVDGEDITASFSINEPYDSVLVRGERLRRDESFLMEISFQQHGEEKASKYAITHHMRRHIEDDPKLEEWARKFKLLPWVAIASPLSQDREQEHVGRLFSTLPLPVLSNQPAHIHGMFSVRPDRATIHSGDDNAISEATESSKGARWNKWLFQKCVVDAWISNLQFIQEITDAGACSFQGWTRWPAGFQPFGKRANLGTGTLGAVFTRVVKEDLRLLPTISDTSVRGSEVLFATELDESLEDALREAGVVVTYPPSDRMHEISQLSLDGLGISCVSPGSVRTALTKLSGSLNDLSPISRSVLLDYILSDKSYVDVAKCQASLLPMMDGSYQNFQVSSIRYRFSRGIESSLFSECKAFSIDSSKLSPTALYHFNNRMEAVRAFTNVCGWDTDGAVWYCREYLFKRNTTLEDTIPRPDLVEWVNQFWSWVVSKAQPNPSALISAVAYLWLVPLTGDRYRKVGVSSPPALDISGTGNVAQIFRAVLKSSPLTEKTYPLYSGSGISPETTAFFRSRSVISDCENLQALIFWLSSVPNFLETFHDEQRDQLLSHIGYLAGRPMVKKDRDFLQVAMRKLPLFREAFSTSPSRQWINLNQTSIRYVAVSPIEDSLPVIEHANTIFIEKSDPGVFQILKALGLAELPSTQQILEQFIIPKITSTNGETRTSFSKFTLKSINFRLLSWEAKNRLANTSFIPVANSHLFKCPSQLVDPESGAAGLYFDDENVFPTLDYLKEFRESLKQLQMVTAVTERVIQNRLRKYSEGQENIAEISKKVQNLLDAAPNPPSISTEYRELRWIPATSLDGEIRLYNSCECRDKLQESLFKYSMPLTELDVSARWKTELRWYNAPEVRHILKQLEEAVSRNDNAVIISLLERGWLSLAEVSKELDHRTWVPGAGGAYYRRADVFLEDAEFHPYVDVLNPQFRSYFRTSTRFAVEKTPCFQKLKDVHDILVAKGKVEGVDLKVFVSLLDAISARFPGEDLTTLYTPDTDGIPRRFADITAGSADPDNPQMKELAFIHPTITPKTIKSLKIPTIQDRFLERIVGPEFIQQFEQEQDLTTLISDTLQRYPIESTFGEYLANAEDSRTATKICWIADETERYPGKSLITSKLLECQGQALFCYNDGVFTENDFEAVIRIGVGSKRDEPSKIGRFGRGSLTMYRLSSTSHETRCCGTNIQKVPLDVHSELHLGGLFRHLRVRHPDLNTCGEELKCW
ncbi:hypothetical protein K440DRAFT_550295 [Wilcoxina mikolae CBS 423.85]|nr:hypothetical protein K440DRAFT_550295 [Wilcoxina mikolae CBS 423.85]